MVGRERVAAIQRGRIIAAMLEVCAEVGAANVSVAPVVERAGVSRRTFYELFKDCEDCLLAAIDETVERVAAAVVPAWRADGRWRERTRASLTELLHALDDDLVSGRLLIVDTLGAGHRALERRRNVLAHAIAAIDDGRDETKNGAHASALTAEGVVGGVASVLHARLLDGSKRSLLDLAGPLMSMIVLPYLGPAAARRELERPAPKPRKRDKHALAATDDPLREVGMRLTHRTVLVLSAIADAPGASNRQVGKTAGIEDQGQISKLLSRLQRLGLIRNDNLDGSTRGMPNAWTLTEKGERVHGVMSPREAREQERWYVAARDGG